MHLTKNINALYKHRINRNYVKAQVTHACKHYGRDIKITRLAFLDDYMLQKIIVDTDVPLETLHELNLEIILETAKQLADEPNLIDENLDNTWGLMRRGESEYTEYSMRGDTWHPEDLFMENTANRKKAYSAANTADAMYTTDLCAGTVEIKSRKFKQFPGNFNPGNSYPRYFDKVENNCEDRRTQINKKLYY